MVSVGDTAIPSGKSWIWHCHRYPVKCLCGYALVLCRNYIPKGRSTVVQYFMHHLFYLLSENLKKERQCPINQTSTTQLSTMHTHRLCTTNCAGKVTRISIYKPRGRILTTVVLQRRTGEVQWTVPAPAPGQPAIPQTLHRVSRYKHLCTWLKICGKKYENL